MMLLSSLKNTPVLAVCLAILGAGILAGCAPEVGGSSTDDINLDTGAPATSDEDSESHDPIMTVTGTPEPTTAGSVSDSAGNTSDSGDPTTTQGNGGEEGTSSSGGTDVIPECGNGIVEPNNNEECDEGKENDDQGDCTTACKKAVCGDGLVNVNGRDPELCDDGNDDNTDACTDFEGPCTPASCGDGYLWKGHEQCDLGGEAPTNTYCLFNDLSCDLSCLPGFKECKSGDKLDPNIGCVANDVVCNA